MAFNEEKITQLCAYLLKACGGQRMPYLKALKLLYFIDRESLRKTGYPVTGDQYFSMKNGPILSETMDLMREEPDPQVKSYWHTYLQTVGYDLALCRDCPTDLISVKDRELADDIIQKFGGWDPWKLVEETHKLPENIPVSSGRVPIALASIFHALGFDETAAAEMEREVTSLALV